MQELRQVETQIFNCKKCKRLRKVTPLPWPHVYFGKQENLSLMIVMRNPGLENDANKIGIDNFIDQYEDLWLRCKIGKYLLQNLGKDIVMNKMFFCNICKCSSPANSPLQADEIQNCIEYLKSQIEITSPKLIMSFGNEARNVLLELPQKTPIETFYHPSYISRASNFISKQQTEKINIILKRYEI